MSDLWHYVKMCPRCRVPMLWMAIIDGYQGKKIKKGETCRRCFRRRVDYYAVPYGFLHVWDERRL